MMVEKCCLLADIECERRKSHSQGETMQDDDKLPVPKEHRQALFKGIRGMDFTDEVLSRLTGLRPEVFWEFRSAEKWVPRDAYTAICERLGVQAEQLERVLGAASWPLEKKVEWIAL